MQRIEIKKTFKEHYANHKKSEERLNMNWSQILRANAKMKADAWKAKIRNRDNKSYVK